MPSFFQPDPTRRMSALEAKVEQLENTVRRGKPAANMRDLKDGELFDAQNGQVPVYDASVGRWRPGSGGAPAFARLQWNTGGASNMAAGDQTVGDTSWNNAWTVVTDNIGLTFPTDGGIRFPGAGYSLVRATVTWSDTITGKEGTRYLRVDGMSDWAEDERNVVAETGRATMQTVTLPDMLGGAWSGYVKIAHTAVADQLPTVAVTVFYWA